MPDTLTYAQSSSEKLAFYSLVDKTTFDTNQAIRNGAASYFGEGLGDANFTWDQFQNDLDTYKGQQSSSFNDASNLSVYQSMIPDSAYDAYRACIAQDGKGPTLTAILGRKGAQASDGSYKAFALYLSFVAGGGQQAKETVTITSSDPKVKITPVLRTSFTGSGSRTFLVESSTDAQSSLLIFNADTTAADPINVVWKQPVLPPPPPHVTKGLCRLIYPGNPPYSRGSIQTTLSPALCRVMTEAYSHDYKTNASFELGCRANGKDSWDTDQPGGDSDPAFRFWINHNALPPPCS